MGCGLSLAGPQQRLAHVKPRAEGWHGGGCWGHPTRLWHLLVCVSMEDHPWVSLVSSLPLDKLCKDFWRDGGCENSDRIKGS